ncbi:MAG: leukotoxin LktA family filamentous adhesin, partial [Duganella sp.]
MSILSKITSPARQPRAWRLYRARPSALIMALLTVFGNTVGMSFAQNVIVPKGTTATQLVVNGAVTNITTGTLHGTTALNAFNRFEVDRNNTVNLVVPSNAQFLLNMVTDAPVTVNGVVNSLKDGRIGGNVIFADPFGMIVGSAGVLNVGSLTVTTPTRKAIDGVIGSDGTIDALSVSALLNGTAAASGLGVIRIDGVVNARDVIRLQGTDVSVNGAVRAGADVAHQAAFLGAVNADAIAGGAALVDHAGVIEIVASNDVAIAGRVAVDGHNSAAGQINAHAGHDVVVAAGANVTARGQGAQADGGRIVLFGANDATLGQGAVLDASAGASGNGGFVELSATNQVTIDGGRMTAGAAAGQAGKVLIDPSTIAWTGSASDQLSNDGTSIALQADKSIRLDNVVLSSRNVGADTDATRANIETLDSRGASGNITLTAPSITLTNGTRLLANDQGIAPGANGKVTLTATSNVTQPTLGVAAATSSITLSKATIKANDVELAAKNIVDSRYIYDGDTVDKAAGLALTGVQTTLHEVADLLGANLVYSDVVAKATVTVGAGSVLEAARTVKLTAENETKAGIAHKYDPSGVPGSSAFGIGASYISNASKATVVLEAGASVTATDLTIRAHNDASVTAQTKSPHVNDAGQDAVSVAFSGTNADVDATARVEHGATLKVAGALTLAATNIGNYVNETETVTGSEGKAAASVAYATHKSATTAALNANVGDAASVAVISIDEVQQDIVTASSSVGSSAMGALKDKAVAQTLGTAEQKIYDLIGLGSIKPKEDLAPAGSNAFRVGGAIAYARNQHTATATIGAGTAVHATDAVLVAARVVATDFKIGAASSAVSQAADQSTAGTAKNAYSAGLSIADITHDAIASVGDDAVVTAAKIAVSADTSVPIRDTLLTGGSNATAPFTRYDGLETIVSALKNIGNAGAIFNGTSSATAKGDDSEDSKGIYGSVSLLTMNDNARAELGAGAKLHLSGNANVTTTAPWATAFELKAAVPDDSKLGLTGTVAAVTETFSFAAPATVAARYDGTYLFLAGQAPGSGSATGLGASIGQTTLNNNVQAIVREGAAIDGVDETAGVGAVGARAWDAGAARSTGRVVVDASSDARVISLATAGGAGGSFGINGTLTLNQMDSHVRALIDDEATIRTSKLLLEANYNPVLWSIAGSLNYSSSTAVGVGIAINKVAGETQAAIADNDTVSGDGTARASQRAVADATIQVRDLDVEARTDGAIRAASAAGSLAYNSTSDGKPGIGDKLKALSKSVHDGAAKAVNLFSLTSTDAAAPGKVADAAPGKVDAPPPAKKEPTLAFAGAGSASANQTELATSALIQGVTIDQGAGTALQALTVRAVADADIVVGSGAAGIAAGTAKDSKSNSGIAGAVAVNLLGNGTSANITDSTVTHAGDVTVQALTAGEQLAVAIAAAVNVSGQNTDTSNQFVGSISITESLTDDHDATRNVARAGVAHSTITADGSAAALDVTAYNRNYIGTGGGSLGATVAKGTETGTAAAVAFSYAQIDNDVAATIDDATVKQFGTVGVRAFNATEIAAGAAIVGASKAPEANAYAGSTVVSIIRNNTSANIGGASLVEATGNVTVKATDRGADAAIEHTIDPDGKRNSVAPGLDYCGRSATGGAAPAGSCITAVAGMVQLTRGNNYGVSLAWNQIANHTSATIGDATVKATGAGGSIAVLAEADTSILGIAAGVSASGKMAGAGSATLNFIDNSVTAQVGSATSSKQAVLEAATVEVNAADASTVRTLAGQVSFGSNNAVGAALTVNVSQGTLAAGIVNAKLTAADAVGVTADNRARIDAAAIAGAASTDGNAVAGSLALNFIDNSTGASVRASTIDAGTAATAATAATGNAVTVSALDASVIRALSGAAAAAGKVGAGAALSFNSIDNASRATIAGSTLTGVDTLALSGKLDSEIQSAAIALGVGTGEVGLAGSVTINQIGLTGNVASAELDNSTVTAGTKTGSAGKVAINATDDSAIAALAGAVGGGADAGFGAAVADNGIATTVTARLHNSSVHQAAKLDVNGASTASIKSASVAGAGGGDVGGAGSASANHISNKTYAELVDAEVDGGQAVVQVQAVDAATIDALAGAGAVGGTAAAGLSLAVNVIGGAGHTQTAQARVSGKKAGTQGLTVDDLLVQASSASAIRTIAAAGAAGGTGGVGGSVVTNVVAKDVAAFIDAGAKVTAANNVGVLAFGDDQTAVIAGALGAGGAAGIGVSSAFNQIDGDVRAYVDGATTRVDAGARDATRTIAVNSGELVHAVDLSGIKAPRDTAADLSETQLAVRGLAVNASSHQSVNNIAVSVGVSGGVSGAVVPVINLMGGATSAFIHGAQVNTGAGPAAGADVNVMASSHAYTGDFAMGAAAGQGAATGAASASRTDRSTSAYITDATIGTAAARTVTAPVETIASSPAGAPGTDIDLDEGVPVTIDYTTITRRTVTSAPSVGAIKVQARASQSTADIVSGLAAGLVAGTATGAVTIFGGNTSAYVENGQLTAHSLAVDAKSTNAYNMLAVSGAAGIAGIGGAFGVGIASGATDAHVGHAAAASRTTTLALDGALTVTALTDNRFTSSVASGSAGGLAGVAGSAAVTVVQNSTTAGIYNVQTLAAAPAATPVSVADAHGNVVVTTDSTGGGRLAAPLGAVTVAASETIAVKALTGAVAASAGAGVGAAANVVVAKSSVTAELVDSAIDSAGKVAVTAASDKAIDMTSASGGAGATVGIGGALGVLVVGSGATGNANDELDKGNDGTLTQVNSLTTKPTSAANRQDGQRAAPTFDVKAAVNGLNPDAVTARIAGGAINGSAVKVDALATTMTANTAGAVAVGGALGAGGAVGVSRVYSTVDASIVQANVRAASVDVSAVAKDGSGPAATVTAYAGGAGLVGLGAAVADALIQNQVTAHADGAYTGAASGAMQVAAADNTSVATDGMGAAAGAAAIGVVVSHADKRSTVAAALGGGSTVTGYNLLAVLATSAIPASGATVKATATGAAGGLLLAGAGAESVASNHTQVSAAIGDDVALPDGNVSIAAVNDSAQQATATGIAGAGLVAASGAVARAESGTASDRMRTSATLGNNATTSTGRAGYLQVNASGVDANAATATAAAGGVIAGNASDASTRGYADMHATVGSNADIHAGAVLVSVDHVDSHADHANSVNASLVGGSGAKATHTADVTVAADIGRDSKLASTGTIQVLADNMFDNNTGSAGETASGAGGGVFNGAAAGSTTNIIARTTVGLGDRVTLSSGPSATTSPYTMVLRAANHVSLADTVVLGTGGLVAGAGVSARTTALLNSDVTTGLGDQLISLGSIGIGSYADAAASASALVETHGLAAVGSADASVDLTANQNVRIAGGGSVIRSFGNIDVTAGKDPTGDYNTVLTGNASAQGYVKGLIAVPSASASSNLSSNARLDIDRGATVESAQNAVVGAYQGASYAQANGTGRGYELGFIPVTSGSSSTSTPSTANVTIDGNVNAGIYHDLTINIDDCRSTGIYCSQVVQSANSAPTTIAFDPNFDAAAYVRASFSDPATRELMLSGISAGTVGAVKLGALYAAGGTVTVNAANLKGAGALSSYGAPKITVINNSADYLLIDSAMIPNTPGGEVLFSGTAGRDAALANHMQLTETGKGEAATISIQNNYADNVGGVAYGPALILMGQVNNLGGKIEIVNKTGSVGQNGQILGKQVNIDAPRGVFAVQIPDSQGPFYAGSSPYAEWQKAMIWPGGNYATQLPSANLAISYVASSVENAANFRDTADFNRSFVHIAGAAEKSNFSRIYYGASYRHQDTAGTANANSPIGQSLNLSNQSDSYIAMVPMQALTYTSDTYGNADLSGSKASSAIYGSKVAITARYIDINGKITAGQPTDWSLTLPASLATTLQEVTARYRIGGGSATVVIDPKLLGLTSPTDSPIKATFDVVTQQIT